MVASIGTGRYREFAQAALESGLRFLGGDCDPSFHLLTDNVSGTALSGSISTILTVLNWICLGIHGRGSLPSPVRALAWLIWC